MRVNWGRELSIWAQYFLLSFVAATAALVLQAQAEVEDWHRLNEPLPPGLSVNYSNLEVIKGSGEFYFWWFCIFLGFGLLRLLILFITSRDWASVR